MAYQYRGETRTDDDDPYGCGTPAGYRRHIRNKTAPCPPCRAAGTWANQQYYAKNREKIKAAAKRRRPSWKPHYTKAELAKMKRLYNTGWSYEKIASELGRTPRGVKDKITRLQRDGTF